MGANRTTNILLVLVVVALVANIVVPMLRTADAVAAGRDAVPPAKEAAEVAKGIAPDKIATQIADGLRSIAQSNSEIAAAILEHARSNERIAYALDSVAAQLRAREAASAGE